MDLQVSIPPSHMITEEKTNPWINSSPGYVRPRLYTPFYEGMLHIS